jgi:hypothetical protein
MSVKVEPGTYQCKTTAATIEEYLSGAVMCRIGLDLGLTGGICLIQKDGTLSEKNFKSVQAILEIPTWDWNAWACEPDAWAGHDVEAVIETVQGEKGEFSSVKYLNPPGGARMEKPDAKALAAKYGAKTRALFGGVPTGTASGLKPASHVKAPPPKPKAPPPSGPVSTMEACWDKWCEAGNDSNDADQWYKTVKTETGKDQNDCGPGDWGKLMASLTDNLPGM